MVIDNCPRRSVLQGYRIVKAIEASEASVHVVVKSFFASMAAILTTLADHSYAYPNAVILHHQRSSTLWGNMPHLKQEMETLREWERRLAVPVSEKMGVAPERIKQMMYESKASGDWEEFADEAVKLKWVASVFHEICRVPHAPYCFGWA